MLSRFSTVVQSAVNALAPPAPLLEDFEYHWKRLMNHYLVVSPQNRAAIELTNIPFHLDSLYDILVTEKSNSSHRGETGACLEYLLQNGMMNLLATLGSGDDPPGMKQYVLRFTCKIINQFYNPLLAHPAIYQPIKRLIESCDGNKHSASETDEVQFLCTLSCLLRQEIPYTSIFFTNELPRPTESNAKPKETKEDTSHQCPGNLLDALLTYINSADTVVRIKVCQAIMLLVSMRENRVSDFIVTDTNLTVAITTRLVNLFDDIRDNSDVDCIQEINVSWALDALMSDSTSSYHGYSQLVLFFSWFDFINQLISESEAVISAALCEVFKLCFVECVFSAEFLNHVLSLAVLTRCISMSTAPALYTVFRDWLLGDSTQLDTPTSILCPQKKALLDSCFSPNDQVSLHALKLFTALLEKYDESTLNTLVIAYVNTRAYHDTEGCSDVINSWSDEEDEREKKSSDSKEHVSRTLAPSNVDKIIERYQSLVPPSLRSSASEPRSDYQVYLGDVEHVYKQVRSACDKFHWPSEATATPSLSSAENQQPVKFYEGAFLNMVFTKLKSLSTQSYLINLELSSVLSRLAVLPHPHLHEYLLNPYCPRLVPSLAHLLSSVAKTLGKQLHAVEHYGERLANTRQYLVGNSAEIRDNQSNLFESVIVLEEMCKELAAIVYVKFHCAS
ncbi:protein FAM160B1 [Diaphorina citri]|uniref:Protein FAM160B1 n=1 Tax=Diaphorina citri TaxID=121845 RepID=A0A1S4EI72_DIACI|nr:protein FAM160B1 [Diaphorina citri]